MPGLDFDFKLPDPFAKADPFKRSIIPGLDDGASPRRSQRPEFRQPLTPEQHDSLASQALGVGASGLSYVLGTLDKPGQAVRGILAGKGLSSLKHLVPFSDAMGLTTDADHTTGRDLTNKLGLTDQHDKGWGAWGTGLAADIATDPLTYMTFGAKHALTGTGKALQKTGALKGWTREALLKGFDASESALRAAGKTTEEIAHLANKGQRIATPGMEALGVKPGEALSGLVRVGVPFGPKVSLGTGRAAQAVARAGDATGDFLRFGNPIGRAAGSLFDHRVGGAVDAITQRGWERYGQPTLESLKAAGRDDSYRVLEGLDPLIRSGAHPERTITDAARAVAEGVPHNYDPALAAQLQGVANEITGQNARYFQEARQAGLPLKDLADQYAGYVHRQAIDASHRSLQLGAANKPRNLFPVVSGSNIGRESVLRDIPGGTSRLNDWFDRFAGQGKKGQVAANASAIRRELEQDLIASGRAMDPKIAKAFDAKAIDLAQRIGHANELYRTTADRAGIPFFTPDLAGDAAQRAAQHARTVASARAVVGAIGDVARRFRNDGTMVAVPDLLKRLGLQTHAFDKATGKPAEGALVEAMKALARHGAGPVDPFLTKGTKAIRKAAGGFGVSREHADQILKAYQKWAAPEQVKSTLGAFDSITNAFKALAYPIWIPAHVRNAFTAGTNNLRRGVGLGDYLDQLKVMTGRGGRHLDINPAMAALPEAERVAVIRRQQFASAGIFGGHDAAHEIAGSARQALENASRGSGLTRFTPIVPGTPTGTGNVAKDAANLVVKEGLLGSLGATSRTAWNLARDPLAVAPWNWGSGRLGQAFSPLGIKGVNGALADALPAVTAGRKAGTNIENFFRGAQWIREVKNGAVPEMAAREVNKLHFDYDALTGFEKNVMRRLVPFYTFARRNLPLQVETALTQPGLFSGTYKPFNQPQPGGKGYVPEYLASGVAIPVGDEVDVKRQYVSKLGLPGEEAFEKLHFKGGVPDVRATALDYLSQLNPVLKAPLEQLFDTQFHTQRRLSDLKAPQAASAIGRLFGEDNPQLLSQVMANSPLTRFVTSADKLLDSRKGAGQKALNLLTGVRVTDVDTDKQRAVELRGALEEMMRGHPHLSRYSAFYVRPEDAADLSPEEIQLMRMYSTIQDRAKEYARQKRERIGIRP